MQSNNIYLLEFIELPHVILENGDRFLLDNYTSQRSFKGPDIDDFREFIKLIKHHTPYMLFNNTFECPQLYDLFYDSNTVDLLNNKGLHIYLTENLMKYDGDRIEHNHTNLFNFLDEKFVVAHNSLRTGVFKNPRCGQLDSITKFIENNKLTNVTIFVPEHGVRENMPRYKNLNICYRDLFLEDYISKIEYKETVNKDIKYTFINTNWRYEPFRHVTAAYLSNYNSKLSWFYKSTVENFKKNIWFEPSQQLLQGLERLNDITPTNVDTDIKEEQWIEGHTVDRFRLPSHQIVPLSVPMYNDCFCSIVNESNFLDITSYVSEKTLAPIINFVPFVVVGPANSLKVLKDLGFKTFNRWWDESYDSEHDHTKRIHKVFDVIDQISEYSNSELVNIRRDMQDILIYNMQHLKTLEL